MRGGATLLLTAHAKADPILLLIHRSLHDGAARATFGARHIGDHALGIEGWRKECRRAVVPWTGFLSGLAAPLAETAIALHVARRVVVKRLAGLGIDALGPGHLLLVLVGPQELAVGAVERIVEAVTGEVRHNLADFAVDVRFIEHLGARRVEIPVLVGRLLEEPHDLAGI